MEKYIKTLILFCVGFLSLLSITRGDSNNIILDDPHSAVPGAILTGASGTNYVGLYTGSDNGTYSFLTDGTNYTILNDNPLAQAGSTVVNGISGTTIFGSYLNLANKGVGFLNSISSTNYISIANPQGVGTNGTTVLGISGNNSIGDFVKGSGITNSFFYNGTNFVTLYDTNGLSNATVAVAVSGGIVVGNYKDSTNGAFGFFFDGTNYTTVDYSTNTNGVAITSETTMLIGISGGTVVGNAQDDSTNSHGFLCAASTATFTPIDVLDSNAVPLSTMIAGISGSIVVGDTIDASGTITNGFLTTNHGASYTTVVYPSATNGSVVLGIGSGTLYGTYQDSNLVTRNFVYNGTNYTTIDGPPSGTTVISASTNGSGTNAVGSYIDVTGITNGYLYNGTNYTTLNNTNAALGTLTNIAVSGTNLVGTYIDTNTGYVYGFVYNGTKFTPVLGPDKTNSTGILTMNGISGNRVVGTYTESDTGNNFTYGFLIVNNGPNYTKIIGPDGTNAGITSVNGVSPTLIVGNYTDTNSTPHGFSYTGSYKNIDDPLAQDGTTVVAGVSGSSIVGTYADANSPNTYGFLLSGTVYTTLYGPDGTNGTGVNSINGISGNNIVGTYADSNTVVHGFLYNGTNYTVIDFPGAPPGQTMINGVLGSMIYGTYSDSNGLSHGFTIQRANQSITFSGPLSSTNGSTLLLSATNSAGLQIYYSVLSGPATISSNTLTFIGAGTVTLEANQSGNNAYYAAVPVTNSVSVARGSQTITFGAVTNQVYGVPFTVTPTSSSGLQVSVNIVSGSATNSGTGGTTILPTGAGTLVLRASQTGDSNYLAAATVTNSVTVLQATQSITPFTGITNMAFTTNLVSIVLPTASSSNPVTITATGAGTNASNHQVRLLGTGTVTLTANQSGNSNYLAAPPVITNFLVSLGSQTITPFSPISSKIFGDASFTVTPPAASSGLPLSLSIASGPATLSNTTVTLTGAGTVTLAADQPGNSNYSAAPEITTSFAVAKGSQTIAPFPTIPNQQNLLPVTVSNSPTASSGLPVTLSILSGEATIAGNTVTPTNSPTTIVLAANQAGDTNYNAAPQITTSFSVGKMDQTIASFSGITNQPFSTNPILITVPTATSGNPVTLSVLSGPAIISNNSLTLTGIGTVVLTANQPGDATYGPAAQVTTSFVVAKASQTIAAFAPIANQKTPTTVIITTPKGGNSTNPVIVSVLPGSPAVLSFSHLISKGKGIVTLVANQAGDANYLAAPQITTNFLVIYLPQTIAPFTGSITNGTMTYSPKPFVVPTPKSSSGLGVTLSVLSGPVIAMGSIVTLQGTGTVTLAATQRGTAIYAPAVPQTVSFTVTKAPQTIGLFTGIKKQIPYTTNSVSLVIPKSSSEFPVTLVASGAATNSGNLLHLTGVGTVTLTATQIGSTNYLAASPRTTNFVVTQATQTIKPFKPIAAQTKDIQFTLTNVPIATSGLPVSVGLFSGSATIVTNNSPLSYSITPTAAGSVTLIATQELGDANYKPASPVKISFTVKVK